MKSSNLSSRIISSLALLVVFLVAPVTGVILSGEPITPYLQFPPLTTKVDQSSFSWIAFIVVLLFVFITTWPFWRRFAGRPWRILPDHSRKRMPWWGWLSAAGVALFWVLAWNRFPWFEPFQRLTFFPIWFCFIIFLNGAAVWMSGKSLMTHRPLYFVLLFPTSAAFWWTFEYLNRFVNNWYYIGASGIGGWQYFVEASLAFSIVLPAVMSIRLILLQTSPFAKAYRNFPEAPRLTSRTLWRAIGVMSVIALIAVGWIPEITYPLVWIIPGLLWVVYQRRNDYINPMLRDVSTGDFTLLWTSAFAGLICGFFWEMWNLYSQAKWVYSIPALDRFHLFEMPLAGYFGYLPFGVICALVATSLLNTINQKEKFVQEEA
ncbi:MAG TPA: hypothetical protein VF181_01095 [Balneolaceae bacterium]